MMCISLRLSWGIPSHLVVFYPDRKYSNEHVGGPGMSDLSAVIAIGCMHHMLLIVVELYGHVQTLVKSDRQVVQEGYS